MFVTCKLSVKVLKNPVKKGGGGGGDMSLFKMSHWPFSQSTQKDSLNN